MDVVEVTPSFDSADITALAVAIDSLDKSTRLDGW
nr:hypothetical protein [Shewanella sp. SG41-4]